MSTITTLVGTDGITTANSMAKINTNFTNLNTDKIETSYIDTDTTLAANSDSKIATQKAVKAYVDSGGNVNASETARGIVEEATDAEVTAGTGTGATGAKLFVTPAKLATNLSTKVKFGGTGADGALAITSGTTTIDLANASVVTKNYTSISITGTGQLAFSNPNTNGTIIILKSQGGVTITSSATPGIEVSELGSAGGAGATNNTTTCGSGGKGGGALYIECGGALNFTGTIYAKGANGTNQSGATYIGGGGGGGGGGTILALYSSLTASSGSTSVVAGTTGTGKASGTVGNGNADGASGSSSYPNLGVIAGGTGAGLAGGTTTSLRFYSTGIVGKFMFLAPGSGGGGGGTDGGAAADGGTGVGASLSGGTGYVLIAPNTEFA